MDEVHFARNSRLFCIHDGVPADICLGRASHRILQGVHRHRASALVQHHLLDDYPRIAVPLASARLCLEVVSLG